MNSIKRRRMQRSASQTEPRNRQLFDLIQMACLYEKEDLLCQLDPSDDNYEDRAAAELSVLASISIAVAKIILKLRRMRHNDTAWSFLKHSSRFRIFDELSFTNRSQSDCRNVSLLDFSFLESFSNGYDNETRERKIQSEGALDKIALTYTKTARDLCVVMFLKCVSVISTLCSFFPEEGCFDKLRTVDIIERYFSDSWSSDSRQMQYNMHAIRQHAVDGWFIVSELFKVQVQELKYWKQHSSNGSSSASTEGKIVITETDVRNTAHLWCHRVVTEFFAWTYHLLKNEGKTVHGFLEIICDVIDKMNEKLAEEMECEKKELIPEDLITSTLTLAQHSAPTMAQVRYDGRKMVPHLLVRKSKPFIKWIPEEVLMRGRWEGSPALRNYDKFIKAAQFAQKQEGDAQQLTGESSVPTTRLKDSDTSLHRRTEPFEAVSGSEIHSRSTPLPIRGCNATPAQFNKRTREEAYDTPTPKRLRHEYRSKVPTFDGSTRRVPAAIYLNDGDDSDDENDGTANGQESEDQISGQSALTDEALTTNISIQRFYEMILKWPIFELRRQNTVLPNGEMRPLNTEEKLATPLLSGMKLWIEAHVDRTRKNILPDVTAAKNIDEYRDHWRSLIPIEVRAMVSDSIATLLPTCKAKPSSSFTVDIKATEFIQYRIEKVSPAKGLLNITCNSVVPNLNKRIAQEFQGGTLCVGYFQGKGKYTDLILVACRRVNWEADDEAPLGKEDTVDEIELRLVVNLHRVREVGIWEGGTVYLRHLCHFAPAMRMYKAIEESFRLPTFMRDTLFGANPPPQVTDADVMEELIDSGCADYVKGLRQTSGRLGDSQLHALRSVLANVGKCGPNSSSVSLVHGPPGTGKTTLIIYLVGALLHHAEVGHIGREQVHPLQHCIPSDNIQRCRKDPGGVRILICCPSNKAVNNILERIHRDGVPDGKGGAIWPQTVRLARARYDHGELYLYSVDHKALPFDEHIHNVGQRNRRTASTAAKRSLFQECVVVLATLVSSGGARFKKSKIPFNVVITDEIGQASEPEALIPLTNTMKHFGQCHFIGVGDPLQLPPFALASYPMRCMKSYLHFDYDKQMMSVFERLQNHRRAACQMLTKQYRMCQAVADMSNKIFYGGKLEIPLPESNFDAPYNKGWDPASMSFARQTFIDTSHLPNRAEFTTEKDGQYMNAEEINIIDEILHRIKVLSGDKFDELRNQIAVLTPYRSQVDQMRLILERTGKYVRNGVSRQGFDILVDSVDSMQGSEKDIVIFGSTRSNTEQKVGFLERPNRLNVATSRAKKLQIIVGDFSTLEGNKFFATMRQFCQQERTDVVLLQLHPTAQP